MMIAPGEAGPTLGAIQPQTSVRWTRRVAGLYAHRETDTARTQPTKHGPLGCRAGQRAGRRSLPPRVFCKSNRFWLPPQQLTSACSRAVRALSGVSALCPFLNERRDQLRAESSAPMSGVGSLRASLPASRGAIINSDAIH